MKPQTQNQIEKVSKQRKEYFAFVNKDKKHIIEKLYEQIEYIKNKMLDKNLNSN